MNLFCRTIDAGKVNMETLFDNELDDFNRCRLLGIWRSPLEREIRQRGPKRTSAWEWQNHIKNLTRSGVSQDEIDTSGVIHWLQRERQDQKLLAEEILDYLDEFGLKIHVMQERGWTLGRPWFFVNDPDHPCRFQSSLSNDRRHNSRFGVQVELAGLFDPERAQGRWVVRYRQPEEDHDRLLLDAGDPGTAVEYVHGLAWRHINVGIGPHGRYSLEALSGGNNYREILFVIPNVLPRVRNFHFPVQNIFCHLRLVDRLDENGDRLLHIEEIQSDWHNPHIKDLDPPMKGQWMKIALSWCVQEALERGLAGVSLSDGAIQLNRNGENRAPGLKNFYRHVQKTLNTLVKKIGGRAGVAVYHCHEQKYTVRSGSNGWSIIDRYGHPALTDIPSREEATKIRHDWLPDGPVEVAAFRFQSEEASNWPRPFYRLDPDSNAPQQPASTMTARGQAALKLLDEIDAEVFEAALCVAGSYYGEFKDCMWVIQSKLENQDFLRDEISEVFHAYAEEALRLKMSGNQTRLIPKELDWLRKTTVALQNDIRQHGDLPEDWWAVCPQRAVLRELLENRAAKLRAATTD